MRRPRREARYAGRVNVLEHYREAGGLLEGHFLLASGRHTPTFLQSTTVLQHPARADALGAALAETLREHAPSFVIGPAMGGVVLAHVVARALGCRALFAEKSGPGMSLRSAFAVAPDEPFAAVEDVLTTGGSLRRAVEAAERRGGRCVASACLIDRGLWAGSEAERPRSLLRLELPSYPPEACPLCADGLPLEEV